MNAPPPLPADKRSVLDAAVAALRDVRGVRAVALGGSYAAGRARPDSDVDIGIYYSESSGLAIDEVRTVARELSSDGRPTVTELYSWGPWVNGGAWINTRAGRVDFL